MRIKMKYKTPEIEVTRFEANKAIMMESPTHEGEIVSWENDTKTASEVDITDLLEFD